MTLLKVSKLTKYFGADLIFQDLTLQVSQGEKVALVGVNGAGKSTLIRIIAGLAEADGGEVALARGTRLAFLAQEEHFGGQHTLWQEMEAALSYVRGLQAEIASLEQELHDTAAPDWAARMARYGELTAAFEHHGGYLVEQNVKRMLQGLGFSEEHYDQPLARFSGGQKTRAALAATLLSDPDLLLLDEPTNHLDLEAMEWLDGFLKAWPGTLIVVSHDRRFLDRVTQRTLDLTFGSLEDYPAGYHRYLDLKAERLEFRLKEYAAQQELIARTEEFVRRYKAGQRAREARGREKRLNRLKEQNLVARPREQDRLKLSLASHLRGGDLVLTLDGLAAGYWGDGCAPGRETTNVLVQAEQLELARGERVAIIGPNGCGKTTLLRTIVGELSPLEGRVRIGRNIALGYYAQGHDSLDLAATVLDEILRVDSHIGVPRARTLLGRFLFSGDDVFKRVGDLSGGERSRLALAQLTLRPSNLLVMDEPTNHLDIDAREALEAVLADYAGSILFVSHDRYFIDALADKLWVIRDGNLVEYRGNYSDYVVALEDERRQAREEQPRSSPPRRRPRDEVLTAAAVEQRAERQRQRRLAAIEATLEQLEQELAQIKEALETASAAQDVEKVSALGLQYVALEQQRDGLYVQWEQLASLSAP